MTRGDHETRSVGVGILDALQSQGGTISVAVGLTAIIVWLFRSLSVERRGRTEDTVRWRAELARVNRDHDQEIGEMRAKITRLETRETELTTTFRTEVDRLNQRLDHEMELRRAAQYGQSAG